MVLIDLQPQPLLNIKLRRSRRTTTRKIVWSCHYSIEPLHRTLLLLTKWSAETLNRTSPWRKLAAAVWTQATGAPTLRPLRTSTVSTTTASTPLTAQLPRLASVSSSIFFASMNGTSRAAASILSCLLQAPVPLSVPAGPHLYALLLDWAKKHFDASQLAQACRRCNPCRRSTMQLWSLGMEIELETLVSEQQLQYSARISTCLPSSPLACMHGLWSCCWVLGK